MTRACAEASRSSVNFGYKLSEVYSSDRVWLKNYLSINFEPIKMAVISSWADLAGQSAEMILLTGKRE